MHKGHPVGIRFEELIQKLGLNPTLFAQKINVPQSTIHYIIGKGERKSKPTYEVLNKIKQSFTNVNIDWLITGNGMILLDNLSTKPLQEKDSLYYNLERELDILSRLVKAQGTLADLHNRQIATLEAEVKALKGTSNSTHKSKQNV